MPNPSSDDETIDGLNDNYESHGDFEIQNIKATSIKSGDQAMWDLFEVSFSER